ncbi:hypothetical protein GR255_15785, partial [Mycobacterium tuberculosis]|nr:hypothetical protein [Mycobacterium tuberculosis]
IADADGLRNYLQSKGIAVRRGDTFVGLDARYLQAAVSGLVTALFGAPGQPGDTGQPG